MSLYYCWLCGWACGDPDVVLPPERCPGCGEVPVAVDDFRSALAEKE
ncbi:MAG: hypothetical protein MUF54_08270 [Polyangiaceae bacterium]|nr:hypothetical protein [Polyangiaceae bacterium]